MIKLAMPNNTPSLNIKECIFNGAKHRKTSTLITKEKKSKEFIPKIKRGMEEK
jgi:hypothetical protein